MEKNNIRMFFVRYRLLMGYILAILFVIFVKPEKKLFIPAIIVSVAGEALRTWASGYIHKDKVLARDGPYSFVRNPLYLGSFLVGLGISLLGGWIWVMIFVVFFLVTYTNLILYEEEKLEKIFGEEFIQYRESVPRLFPDPRKFRRGGDYDFSLAMKKHREWQTWLGIFSIFVILFIKTLLITK